VALRAGERLGPYEILGGLGAGGMGEVYRARDPRLGRTVAIKILPSSASADPSRRHRFEHEARAAGLLNHPNVLAIYDVGDSHGAPFLVTELLEGETLRERLHVGALPVRKAADHALQVARGLTAAHDKGIVHRDLKPENLFLTKDGIVKILDFGLARLEHPPERGSGVTATMPSGTDAGTVMGTAGYMSPEQVRGETADHRSDLFSLGAVLYEMVTGRRAFHRDSSVETLNAILKEEPEELPSDLRIPPALDRIVRHCIEKKPEERFQSARDLAFALEALSTGTVSEPVTAKPAPRYRRWQRLAAGLLGAAGVAALAFVAGRRTVERPQPVFKQLTFRRGWVDEARFAPDARTVVYGAGWDGKPVELFQTRTDSPASRPLGVSHAKLLSISSQGQMAILLDPSRRGGLIGIGTLAILPLAGGTPRELLEDVFWADWTPDGRDLCVSRLHADGEVTIELPPGTVLHRTRGYTCMLRVSRDGRRVVFEERLNKKVVIIDRDRKLTRTLVEPLAANFWGLAWAPTGRDVWFTEGPRRTARDLHAVDLEGRRRVIYRSAGGLALVDSAPGGRILLHRALDRLEAMALLPGRQVEQDVTVYDNSMIGTLSADGRLLLLDSIEEEGRFAYLRREGGDPVRLAAGVGVDISTDRRSALILTNTGELSEVPIGPGLPRKVELGTVRAATSPRQWAGRGSAAYVPAPPGGVIVRGRERPDEPEGLWRVDEGGSKPRRLEFDALGDSWSWDIAPDGRHVAVKTRSDAIRIVALAGERSRDIRIADVDLSVSRWSGDGRSLFLVRVGRWPCEIHRLDLATEKVELWKQIAPPDPTGIVQCVGLLPSADGRSYAYTANRSLASLVVADGLR
jgi:hypothetical protein